MNEVLGTLYYVFAAQSPTAPVPVPVNAGSNPADGAEDGADGASVVGSGPKAGVGETDAAGAHAGHGPVNSVGFDGDAAEADTFACFTVLMGELRDVYVKDMDESESGIRAKMQAVNDLLARHDPGRHARLEALGLDPTFY